MVDGVFDEVHLLVEAGDACDASGGADFGYQLTERVCVAELSSYPFAVACGGGEGNDEAERSIGSPLSDDEVGGEVGNSPPFTQRRGVGADLSLSPLPLPPPPPSFPLNKPHRYHH